MNIAASQLTGALYHCKPVPDNSAGLSREILSVSRNKPPGRGCPIKRINKVGRTRIFYNTRVISVGFGLWVNKTGSQALLSATRNCRTFSGVDRPIPTGYKPNSNIITLN